ncbi:hypothetical protein MCEMAEM21_00545 [Oxalobacteraceae bacterium]|jgi:hypothetical protein
MDLMTLWLDGSIADSDSRASSAYQKLSKLPSKKKGGSGGTAKKSTKAGKKADAKASSKAGTEKKKLDVKHAALVRDSFTIPGDELQLLADAKKKCLKAGIDIKKSELIRIGISLVYGLGLSRLKKEKRALQPIKTGRPKKAKLV